MTASLIQDRPAPHPIWRAGRIRYESALALPIEDRTLEHGLGLFETVRTWRGEPRLWPRHRRRLLDSAQRLGLPLDPADLPSAADLIQLVHACRSPQVSPQADAALRVNVSGGGDRPGSCLVWATLRQWLDPDPFGLSPHDQDAWMTRPGLILDISAVSLGRVDPLARFKTLNYWTRRWVFEHRAPGSDEVIVADTDGLWLEASRSNLFWVRGQTLFTTATDRPILPGVMRGLVLEVAGRLWKIEECAGLDPTTELACVDELFLTNAARGLMPVAAILGRWRAPQGDGPGPVASALAQAIRESLSNQSIDGEID